jgi:hypothetical protein
MLTRGWTKLPEIAYKVEASIIKFPPLTAVYVVSGVAVFK